MLKRPVIGIVIFFAGGILASELGANSFYVLLAFVVSSAGTFFFRKKLLPLFLVCAIVFFLGAFRIELTGMHRDKIFREVGNRKIPLSMTVTDFSEKGRVTAEFKENGRTHKIYLYAENQTPLSPGDIIKAEVRITRPSEAKTGKNDFSRYLASRDIFLCGETDDVKIVGRDKTGIDSGIYAIRRYVNSLGKKFFDGDRRGLFNAMVLGDKRFISDELEISLQKAGLNHIAVVSGMHLSLIIALQMMLFEKLFGIRPVGNILSVAGAVFITLVTGVGASALRACIMCIVYCLSKMMLRNRDSISSLMLTVLVMLLWSPYLLFNAGFVLSVASVLGILLYNERVSEFLARFVGGPVNSAASVCISAQLAVVVPVIYYFGIVTPYSLISNVSVTMFASMVVICGLLFAVVGAIPYICVAAAFFVKFSADAVVFVCRLIEKLPASGIVVENVDIIILSAWICTLILAGMKNPDRKKILRLAGVFTISVFIGVHYFIVGQYRSDVEFYNYGKREMSAIFYEGSTSVLIDCPDSGDAEYTALAHGETEYDCVILPGNKKGDVLSLLNKDVTDTVIVYRPNFSYKTIATLEKDVTALGGKLVALGKNDTFCVGESVIRYVEVGKNKNFGAVVEINCNGERFISLQSMTWDRVNKLIEEKAFFHCDGLKLPDGYPESDYPVEELCRGEIFR